MNKIFALGLVLCLFYVYVESKPLLFDNVGCALTRSCQQQQYSRQQPSSKPQIQPSMSILNLKCNYHIIYYYCFLVRTTAIPEEEGIYLI